MITPKVRGITEHSSHVKSSPDPAAAIHRCLHRHHCTTPKSHGLSHISFISNYCSNPTSCCPTHPHSQLSIWVTPAISCPQGVSGLNLQRQIHIFLKSILLVIGTLVRPMGSVLLLKSASPITACNQWCLSLIKVRTWETGPWQLFFFRLNIFSTIFCYFSPGDLLTGQPNNLVLNLKPRNTLFTFNVFMHCVTVS